MPVLAQQAPAQRRAPGCAEQCRGLTPGGHQPGLAVCSERASTLFGLHIVAPAVQDEAYNRTRFAIICLPQTMEMPPPSSRDCTSLVVSVANRPGAMHDLLVPLKTHGVSMTRLSRARPAPASGTTTSSTSTVIPANPTSRALPWRNCARSARSSLLGAYPRRVEVRHVPAASGVIGCGLMGGSFALAPEEAQAGQARRGLQQVASTTGDRPQVWASSTWLPNPLCWPSQLRTSSDRSARAATEATPGKAIRHLVNPGVLFMDVGSTKGRRGGRRPRPRRPRCRFRALSTPSLAGAGGVANADATLYKAAKSSSRPRP